MPPLPQQEQPADKLVTQAPAAQPSTPPATPPPAPSAPSVPDYSAQVTPETLKSVLDRAPEYGWKGDRSVQASAWDAWHAAKTPEDFRKAFDAINLPRQTKAALWDLKFQPPIEPSRTLETAAQATAAGLPVHPGAAPTQPDLGRFAGYSKIGEGILRGLKAPGMFFGGETEEDKALATDRSAQARPSIQQILAEAQRTGQDPEQVAESSLLGKAAMEAGYISPRPTFDVQAATGAKPGTFAGGAAQKASALSSPANFAQLLTGIPSKLMALVYAGQMSVDVAKQVWEAAGRYAAGDTEGAHQLLGGASIDAVMTALLGKHIGTDMPVRGTPGVRAETAQPGVAPAPEPTRTQAVPPAAPSVAQEGAAQPATQAGMTAAQEVTGGRVPAVASAPIEGAGRAAGTGAPEPSKPTGPPLPPGYPGTMEQISAAAGRLREEGMAPDRRQAPGVPRAEGERRQFLKSPEQVQREAAQMEAQHAAGLEAKRQAWEKSERERQAALGPMQPGAGARPEVTNIDDAIQNARGLVQRARASGDSTATGQAERLLASLEKKKLEVQGAQRPTGVPETPTAAAPQPAAEPVRPRPEEPAHPAGEPVRPQQEPIRESVRPGAEVAPSREVARAGNVGQLLQNPELMQGAVQIPGSPEPAIPVGGARKSGAITQEMSWKRANDVRLQLQGREGFPNPRLFEVRPNTYEVHWGEEMPWRAQKAKVAPADWARKSGQAFGYKPESVEGLASRLGPGTPRPERAGPEELSKWTAQRQGEAAARAGAMAEAAPPRPADRAEAAAKLDRTLTRTLKPSEADEARIPGGRKRELDAAIERERAKGPEAAEKAARQMLNRAGRAQSYIESLNRLRKALEPGPEDEMGRPTPSWDQTLREALHDTSVLTDIDPNTGREVPRYRWVTKEGVQGGTRAPARSRAIDAITAEIYNDLRGNKMKEVGLKRVKELDEAGQATLAEQQKGYRDLIDKVRQQEGGRPTDEQLDQLKEYMKGIHGLRQTRMIAVGGPGSEVGPFGEQVPKGTGAPRAFLNEVMGWPEGTHLSKPTPERLTARIGQLQQEMEAARDVAKRLRAGREPGAAVPETIVPGIPPKPKAPAEGPGRDFSKEEEFISKSEKRTDEELGKWWRTPGREYQALELTKRMQDAPPELKARWQAVKERAQRMFIEIGKREGSIPPDKPTGTQADAVRNGQMVQAAYEKEGYDGLEQHSTEVLKSALESPNITRALEGAIKNELADRELSQKPAVQEAAKIAKESGEALAKATEEKRARLAREAEEKAKAEKGRQELERMVGEGKKPELPKGYGEKNKGVTKSEADEIRKRLLRKYGTEAPMGIDPTVIPDVAKLIAYHIEAGTRAFADVSARLVSEMGEWVRPYLQPAWDSLHGKGAEEAPKTPAAKAAPAAKPEFAKGKERDDLITLRKQVSDRLDALDLTHPDRPKYQKLLAQIDTKLRPGLDRPPTAKESALHPERVPSPEAEGQLRQYTSKDLQKKEGIQQLEKMVGAGKKPPDTLRRAAVTEREKAVYRAHLANPELIEKAVVMPDGQLAVPVGGARKAGGVSAANPEAVLKLLSGKEGFPNLRLTPEGPHDVEWGAKIPWGELGKRPHAEIGRVLGYSEAAIREFMSPKRFGQAGKPEVPPAKRGYRTGEKRAEPALTPEPKAPKGPSAISAISAQKRISDAFREGRGLKEFTSEELRSAATPLEEGGYKVGAETLKAIDAELKAREAERPEIAKIAPKQEPAVQAPKKEGHVAVSVAHPDDPELPALYGKHAYAREDLHKLGQRVDKLPKGEDRNAVAHSLNTVSEQFENMNKQLRWLGMAINDMRESGETVRTRVPKSGPRAGQKVTETLTELENRQRRLGLDRSKLEEEEIKRLKDTLGALEAKPVEKAPAPTPTEVKRTVVKTYGSEEVLDEQGRYVGKTAPLTGAKIVTPSPAPTEEGVQQRLDVLGQHKSDLAKLVNKYGGNPPRKAAMVMQQLRKGIAAIRATLPKGVQEPARWADPILEGGKILAKAAAGEPKPAPEAEIVLAKAKGYVSGAPIIGKLEDMADNLHSWLQGKHESVPGKVMQFIDNTLFKVGDAGNHIAKPILESLAKGEFGDLKSDDAPMKAALRLQKALDVLQEGRVRSLAAPKEMTEGMRPEDTRSSIRTKAFSDALHVAKTGVVPVPKPPKAGQEGFFSLGRRGRAAVPPTRAAQVSRNAIGRLAKTVEALPASRGMDRRIQQAMRAGAQTVPTTPGTFANAYQRSVTLTKTVLGAFKKLPKWQDFQKAMGDYRLINTRQGIESKNFVRTLQEKLGVPSLLRQTLHPITASAEHKAAKLRLEAITNYLEAGGDEQELARRASLSRPDVRPAYELASQLNPEEKAIAQAIKEHFESRARDGMALGILHGYVEDYAPHIWKDKGHLASISAELNANVLNRNFRFAMQRIYGSYFEGEQKGLTAKTGMKRIDALVAVHDAAFNKAMNTRLLARQLMDGAAEDGRPILAFNTSGAVKLTGGQRLDPVTQRMINQNPAVLLKPNMRPFDPNVDMKGYVKVPHPAFEKWIWKGKEGGKNILMQGDAWVHPDYARQLENLTGKSLIRKYAVGQYLLTGNSALKQLQLGAIGAFHYVQEGLHDVWHLRNPLNPDIWTGKRLNAAMADPVVLDGIRHELNLGGGNAAADFGDGLRFLDTIPGAGKYIRAGTDHLFGTFIPSLKADLYKHVLEKNLKHYADDIRQGKIDTDQLKIVSARTVNNAFGDLDTLTRNKTFQDITRLTLLAPDFLEARGRFIGQSVRPYGWVPFTAMMRNVGMLYTAARVLNYAINKDPLWDGKYWDGVRVGDKVYRVRSIVGDMFHAISNSGSFAYWRLSPLMRPIVSSMASVRKGLPYRLKDIIADTVPIGLQGEAKKIIYDNIKDPDVARSIWETIGVREERYFSPEQRKMLEKRSEERERMLRGEKRQGLGPMLPSLPRIK